MTGEQSAEVVLELVFELAQALGVEMPLSKLPGCWEVDLTPVWWMALNGHSVEKTSSTGTRVPPGCVFAMCHRLPAGLLDVVGGAGQFASSPSCNLSHFEAALRQAVSRAKGAGHG